MTSNVGMLLLAHERDDSLDRWLDSLEVYQLLHISPRTLHTMRDNGELPFSKFEGKIWYKRSEADALMIRNGINLNVYSHG
ncbi:MAG: helix-turn-helix domain-containing protein [Rikenellaceae bacterium]|nr:helix-turn-helix domain-containing protein [Rikenellaceae bacterium]